jgi:hypothetical protein
MNYPAAELRGIKMNFYLINPDAEHRGILLIKLNLKKHCVETELKRLYNRSLSQYFKHGCNQKQIEKIIDVIKTVLENSNISNLRSKYPELSGNSEADILLSTDRQDRIVILINGLEINPFEKA